MRMDDCLMNLEMELNVILDDEIGGKTKQRVH
jgi:hypothetical protein